MENVAPTAFTEMSMVRYFGGGNSERKVYSITERKSWLNTLSQIQNLKER